MIGKGRKEFCRCFLGLAITLILGFSFTAAPTAIQAASAFAKGADIGWLKQLEDRGVKWQNDSGVQQDALQILKDHGIDSVRLRVFVNPPSNYTWQKTSSTTCLLGYSDQAGVVAAAQRAKNLGITRIMVDFHYSDHFADPAYQDKPAAWVGHSFSQLVTDVYNHTYSVMNALKSAGITPEWAEIGNEISGGMLWPEGSTSNWSQLAQLINSGYDAVKAVSSSTKVIVHLPSGAYDQSWFYDSLQYYGGKWDVTGLSYYPYWDGCDYTANINSLGNNLNNLASRYGKEVMVVEVGGLESNPSNTYNYLVATINKVKAVPNGMGAGVFYWEPEANSSVLPDTYILGACNIVSTNVIKFTTAMDAFQNGTTPTPTPTISGSTNVALGKTASADSQESANPAANGNDGSTSTRWCAADGNANHWWKVDLGQNYNITGSEVMWEKSGQVYKYKVEVSTDNSTWTLKVDKTNNTSASQIQTDSFTATARYVRITVTGLPSTSVWASFLELRIFSGGATPTPTSRLSSTQAPTHTPTPTQGGVTNLALSKTASADSQESLNPAGGGNDGNTGTRWCAADGNAGHWWKVDLGSSRSITSTEVMWEFARNYKYRIEVSTDNANWNMAVDKTANTSTNQTQTDNFTATARYVRITITGLPTSPATWASFFEFRVYGY